MKAWEVIDVDNVNDVTITFYERHNILSDDTYHVALKRHGKEYWASEYSVYDEAEAVYGAMTEVFATMLELVREPA